MEMFNWDVAPGMKEKAEPKVKVIGMGGGYAERQQDGINNDLREYNVMITVPKEEADPIDDFLTRHNAVKSFLWREPNRNRLITVVCSSWATTVMSEHKTITATFKEVVA
ncbi:phage tail protein [uncultured Gilliamella sp.]|uniref:phage tail protein n=1 Tax=uncultured Gilliamella sp. TaxID=1193505 RepID=UPI0025EC3BBC|nr:phage tail protein [uncultured Gilliamella sp.]